LKEAVARKPFAQSRYFAESFAAQDEPENQKAVEKADDAGSKADAAAVAALR